MSWIPIDECGEDPNLLRAYCVVCSDDGFSGSGYVCDDCKKEKEDNEES